MSLLRTPGGSSQTLQGVGSQNPKGPYTNPNNVSEVKLTSMSLYDYMSTKLFFVCGIPNFDRHLHVLNLFKLFFSVYHGKSRLNHDMAEYLLELLPGTQKANPRWSIGILR